MVYFTIILDTLDLLVVFIFSIVNSFNLIYRYERKNLLQLQLHAFVTVVSSYTWSRRRLLQNPVVGFVVSWCEVIVSLY